MKEIKKGTHLSSRNALVAVCSLSYTPFLRLALTTQHSSDGTNECHCVGQHCPSVIHSP